MNYLKGLVMSAVSTAQQLTDVLSAGTSVLDVVGRYRAGSLPLDGVALYACDGQTSAEL